MTNYTLNVSSVHSLAENFDAFDRSVVFSDSTERSVDPTTANCSYARSRSFQSARWDHSNPGRDSLRSSVRLFLLDLPTYVSIECQDSRTSDTCIPDRNPTQKETPIPFPTALNIPLTLSAVQPKKNKIIQFT